MTWQPKDWRDVFPGQDWRFADGETVHVGAIFWDGTERTALCTCLDGGVLHLPAVTLLSTAEYIGGKS